MNFPVSKLAIALGSLALLTIAEPRASFAQTTSNPPLQRTNPAPSGGGMVGGLISVASGFGGIRTIAGEPFSAEEESERSQVLADGTHVSQNTQLHLYRDSQGRTRSETLPARLQETRAPVFVHIYDPVAKVRYMLDVQRQVAHVMPVPGENRPRLEPAQSDATDQPQTRAQRVPVQIRTSQTTTDPADETPRIRVSHASLGTQTFEGIEARGLQTTRTIPVGAEGNDRPIEIVCENWESPELKLMMLSKCTDPLHGDHTTRVVSIDRSEPDPSLFQVPPDFKIEDQQTRPAPDAATTTER
jgi:hypothetical protein